MSGMNFGIEVEQFSALSASHRDTWRAFQSANSALASPYFAIEFADFVSRAGLEPRVAVISRAGRICGFLPFHSSWLGRARPVGGPLGDHHGLICEDNELPISDALAATSLGLFDFTGVPAVQSGFSPFASATQTSWVIDLSEGYARYLDHRTQAAAKAMRNIRARRRKMDNHAGDVRFRLDDRRERVLEAAISAKRAQYRRTRALDVFSAPWGRALIRELFNADRSPVRGQLSSLEIDGQLAAVHFGMRSQTVLHYWFPVFWPEHSKFGPGLALLMEMAEHLPDEGITEIHLGSGDQDFKSNLANASFPVLLGQWSRPSIQAGAAALIRTIDQTARALPLGRASNWPGKAFRRLDAMAAIRGM